MIPSMTRIIEKGNDEKVELTAIVDLEAWSPELGCRYLVDVTSRAPAERYLPAASDIDAHSTVVANKQKQLRYNDPTHQEHVWTLAF